MEKEIIELVNSIKNKKQNTWFSTYTGVINYYTDNLISYTEYVAESINTIFTTTLNE
jgi:hypothetical protein